MAATLEEIKEAAEELDLKIVYVPKAIYADVLIYIDSLKQVKTENK